MEEKNLTQNLIRKAERLGIKNASGLTINQLHQELYLKNRPAFPFAYPDNVSTSVETGMELRDYFAAKAMQGYLCNQELLNTQQIDSGDLLSEKAYMVADAMLKQRNL